MKRIIAILSVIVILLTCFSGCGKKSELSSSEPVTLTMWHVYGEQADSPMNKLVDEFNRTVGKENGVIINVTLMTNASMVGPQLLEAQADEPGAPEMPDLFFCHNNNAQALGKENLVNWNDHFTTDELSDIVPEFLSDGMVEDYLAVFPVSKSTHLLFMAGGVFDRFSKDTGVTFDDLTTWSGFFDAAEKYYEWSGGKPFCAIDYLVRCVELNALSKGSGDFYTEDGWYDFSNEGFKSSFMEFAQAIAKGHIVVSDLYSNTQVMTGEVASGIGSSASILYYNDTITYSDNTKEPMDLVVLPLPCAGVGERFVTQAGVGLCAYNTTSKKAEAAYIFVKWFTESNRNLDFVAETGYMPVRKDAFEKIGDYEFKNADYESLYDAIEKTNDTCVALTEPNFDGYYNKIYKLYDAIRLVQKGTEEVGADYLWEIFTSVE